MFGAHLSIAGGLVNALIAAEELKMDCVQVFTANQRRWSAGRLRKQARDQWLAKLKELKWQDLRTVSHGSYLVNLASPEPRLRRRSIAHQRQELKRCEMLSIPYCVIHPGAHRGDAASAGSPRRLGADPTADERAGLKRVVKALDQLSRELPGYSVISCLETTVGAGTTLGYDFGHLAYILEHVKQPQRVGFCFDTCHVTAAGYDMSTKENAAAVLEHFDRVCGLKHLHVFHLNDSATPVGSRRDRHAHIGQGSCGLSCFGAIVNCRRFTGVPMILETPKGTNDKGVSWDVANIRRLKRLVRRPRGKPITCTMQAAQGTGQ